MRATNPAVDVRGVLPVLPPELGSKILFLRCDKQILAGDNGRDEKHEHPRKLGARFVSAAPCLCTEHPTACAEISAPPPLDSTQNRPQGMKS